ncbi:hypothetical protein ACO1O0_005801 [Amphichorda felina]
MAQTFANPDPDKPLKELQYVFPLYDGVSVVGFTCTIGTKVIRGVVKEKAKARQVYDDAKTHGLEAGLLEQSMDASDVFTSRIGNVPPGETVKIDIDYLGELKHDFEADAIRFTIPTNIAPRYGPSEILQGISNSTAEAVSPARGFSVTVDAEMPKGSAIRSIQSPSHPITVQIGLSSTASSSDEPCLEKASASLSLGSADLDQDFILQLSASKLGEPSAVLEVHPTIPNQRALMATLVPKFHLPAEKAEIVFVCDRSGSMGDHNKIANLVAALNIFLRSLPVGVKFNICSFGTRFEFLWQRSQTYSQNTLDEAAQYVKDFRSDFGGTEMTNPLAQAFEQRYKDMNLEVFLLTDGEIWDQGSLFKLINEQISQSNGAIRLFTLGIGRDVSHSLIEGAARAGNGFAQSVGDNEQMTKKVVRMLKGALMPHVRDYTLEVKYDSADGEDEEEFELIEKVTDALNLGVRDEETGVPKKPISLFDPSVKDKDDDDVVTADADSKYDHLPQIETPRYLQAPSKIPSLFPYTRACIYVLMSDDSAHRNPKSVLLKGTSTHGPLELEIPITKLSEKGQTIHQLAARSSISELEEGRGWIFHAKKRGSGKLLKEEFDGRFSDMVEREAVRLGLRYQVAGKWCSFVAVAVEGQEEEELDVIESPHWVSLERQEEDASSNRFKRARLDGSTPRLLPSFACRKAAPSPSRWSARLASQNASQGSPAIRHRARARKAKRAVKSELPKQEVRSEDPLQSLASLQTFVGKWSWSSALEKVLGVDQKTAGGVAEAAGLGQVQEDIVATACVAAYLQKNLSGEKDAWEMMVGKAIRWAREQVGTGQYDELGKAVWELV